MKEKLTRAELKEIKQGRKELRKDLKQKGIKGRVDFEGIAREVGLSYPSNTAKGKLLGLWLKAATLAKVIAASLGLYSVLILGMAILGAVLLFSYVSEMRGHFTINLTADMISQGYVLSDTADFATQSTRLYTDRIEQVNAISIQDITPYIDTEADGSHNGTGYMAYTFYIQNMGDEASNYIYDLNITSETNGVGNATWVAIFEDGEQLIYARTSADGDGENLYGYVTMPFGDTAQDQELLYYEENGLYGVTPVEFPDIDVAANGLREDMQPGEIHKYTIVVWIEGDDPECTNDILGGHVGFTFQFEMVEDDELDLFKGLYRSEYDDAQSGVVE